VIGNGTPRTGVLLATWTRNRFASDAHGIPLWRNSVSRSGGCERVREEQHSGSNRTAGRAGAGATCISAFGTEEFRPAVRTVEGIHLHVRGPATSSNNRSCPIRGQDRGKRDTRRYFRPGGVANPGDSDDPESGRPVAIVLAWSLRQPAGAANHMTKPPWRAWSLRPICQRCYSRSNSSWEQPATWEGGRKRRIRIPRAR